MGERYKLKEQLCVSSLSARYFGFERTAHHFEMRNRKIHSSIGYITNGIAEFSTLTEKITAKEGDLIFVPEGIRYISHWDGTPCIGFYDVNFLMPKQSANLWRSMKLQRIDGAPNERILELIKQMCSCDKKEDIGHLQAFGLFYQMLSLILPHMLTTSSHNLPIPLQKATSYVEANYATITSVREIAEACFLSESRLYHLFQDHLNTSPISYLNQLRVHAAIELLSNPTLSIQQIAEQLNFHSDYHFRKTFQKVTGELPSQLRRML